MRRSLVVIAALACAAVLAPSPGPAPAPGRAAAGTATPAPTPTPVATPEPWSPDVAAAREYARKREGVVAFALRSRGVPGGTIGVREARGRRRGASGAGDGAAASRLWGLRHDRTTRSASVVKAMLMLAYLRRPDVATRALTEPERALLSPMIRWSDNDAADGLYGLVGAAGLQDLAARAGMRRFAPHPAWGLSRITAADQTRLFLALEDLAPPRHRAEVLRLLRTVVPEQRWGLAKVAPDGWHLHFKGGWGDGSRAVNHQVALLRRGEERIAVAILTEGNPDHDYGARTLRGVAARLLRGL